MPPAFRSLVGPREREALGHGPGSPSMTRRRDTAPRCFAGFSPQRPIYQRRRRKWQNTRLDQGAAVAMTRLNHSTTPSVLDRPWAYDASAAGPSSRKKSGWPPSLSSAARPASSSVVVRSCNGRVDRVRTKGRWAQPARLHALHTHVHQRLASVVVAMQDGARHCAERLFRAQLFSQPMWM